MQLEDDIRRRAARPRTVIPPQFEGWVDPASPLVQLPPNDAVRARRMLPSGQPLATALPQPGAPQPPATGGLYSIADAVRADEFGGVAPPPQPGFVGFAGDGSALPPAQPPLAGNIPPALAAQQAGLAPALPTDTAKLGDPNRVRIGEPTAGLSPLGKALAKYRATKDATLSSAVEETPWGMEEVPPPTIAGPSRKKQALIGLLQGALIAANASKGDPAATAAGAATGAISGGVSPELMQAFTRKQDLDRQAGDIEQQGALELGAARVTETEAQAAQRRAEPGLRAADLQRQRDEAAERRADREADNIRADKVFEEMQRHHRETEKGKPAADTEEIEVAGRKFKVSPATAARILEARTTAGNKPDPRAEARIEAELEQEAANDHLGKRKAADEQASKLRSDRENVVNQPVSTAFTKEEKAKKIADYDRQIAEAEKESTYRQKEADDSFARRRKALAKAQAAGGGAKKTFNLRAWKADHPNATAAEIAAKRAKYADYQIIE